MKRMVLCAAAVLMAMVMWTVVSGQPTTTKSSRTGPATSGASSRPHTASAPGTAPPSRPATAQAGATVAYIRMAGEVRETPPEFSLLGDSGFMTLSDWLQRLAKARNDKSIQAVALDIDGPEVSWAQAQELADAVARLSAAKPVYAYLTDPGARDHLIASAAREIAMDPADTMTLLGVGVEMLFFRGTLDKLGITPQFIQMGDYKGASEPFSQTEPSKEVKEQYGWILDDLYEQLLAQLTRYRKLDKDAAGKAVDTGILGGADARRMGLVDRLVAKADWRDEVEDQVAAQGKEVEWVEGYGHKSEKSVDFSNPLALLGAMMKGRRHEEVQDPTVAVVQVEGVITLDGGGDDLFGEEGISARRVIDLFEELKENESVKAVIFRIDSPGGSALASERIYQAVRRCAEAKPVIASIGSTGASGGYYVALGADTILADGAGIVGSIGVISGKFSLSGLMDKIGVSRFEITRGASAGLGMSRPWTEREQALIRKHAQDTYDLFLRRVKESRGPRVAKVEDVAGGRIFTARQAKAKGLIDDVGGLREAIIKAQEAAHLTEAHFQFYPRPRSLIDILTGSDPQAAIPLITPGLRAQTPEVALGLQLAGRTEKAALSYLLRLAGLLRRENVLAAMPGYMAIHW